MPVAGCQPLVVTPGTVIFSSTEFLQIYPVFAPQAPALAGNFALATTQLDNGCGSQVVDANLRLSLLYLLTAHITKLLNGEGANPATGVVGRIADASEGSVSAQAEWDAKAGPSQAYYIQTSYGALYWQMTAIYRTARYYPPCDSGYSQWGGGCGC